MNNDSDCGKTSEASAPVSTRGACFDAVFFANTLGARTRSLCAQRPERIPVVLLHLADGSVLDLCHIEQLFADWMVTSVYTDPRSCERMDVVFVPYSLIMRVTVSLPSTHERRIGFQVEGSPSFGPPEGSPGRHPV